MKKLLILMIALIPLTVWSQGSGTAKASPYINYEELSQLTEKSDLLLIDVRTAAEYEAGHIPGAVNIPYNTMPASMPEGSRDKQVVVYCRSGNRSGTARMILTQAGYEDIKDFGGISNWKGNLE